jgi:hypothetical protein
MGYKEATLAVETDVTANEPARLGICEWTLVAVLESGRAADAFFNIRE